MTPLSSTRLAIRCTPQFLLSRVKNLGILQLNNPEPLHALTLEMIHCFHDVLEEWYADDTMQAILLKSSKAKTPAFCSGGDFLHVYEGGVMGIHDLDSCLLGVGCPGLPTTEFFQQEYQVNYKLATATKPQISLWDGIVMGGGVGISIYGKYRVATENTIFALPETS